MRIHFIGIGGIGISALAQYFLAKGDRISGSDISKSEITDALKKKGAKIFISQKAQNLPKDTELVLITPAITPKNPELKEAKKRKIKIQTWEKALGELTKKYFTIAVSGAHGKSTTTALISVILMKAGLDPTVIIGTKLKEFGPSTRASTELSRMSSEQGSNFRFGKSDYLAIEADEYKSSFLNYWPKIIVLTNLEYEHPDYFKNFQHYLKIFKEYLSHLKEEKGIVVANKDDKIVTKMTKNIKNVTFYSIKQPEAKKLRGILKIPGKHNISNSLAALAVARILKIPDKTTFKALSGYRGAWRRFETYKANFSGKNITIVSDYGHHPTQVKSTLQAAKEKYLYPVRSPRRGRGSRLGRLTFNGARRKIWIVYQPHQYLRTYYLFKDYVKAFDEADEIILPEIYGVAGREKAEIVRKLSSKNLKEAIEKRFKKAGKTAKIHFLKDFMRIPQFLKSRLKNNDVVILMGAGDIYKLVSKFLEP